ncbi:Phage protein [Lactococcus lactis subsp. lactis]|nr:Phage protein [Lactococcus lactis subsp. lactis]
MFISSKTGMSVEEVSERISPWHMEHGKRVDDEYEEIKIV